MRKPDAESPPPLPPPPQKKKKKSENILLQNCQNSLSSILTSGLHLSHYTSNVDAARMHALDDVIFDAGKTVGWVELALPLDSHERIDGQGIARFLVSLLNRSARAAPGIYVSGNE